MNSAATQSTAAREAKMLAGAIPGASRSAGDMRNAPVNTGPLRE